MDGVSGTGGVNGVGYGDGVDGGGAPGAGDTSYALAGLDDLPWAERGHAYGAADDVPGLLRALADGDDEAAAEALDELYGCILHQGTVYAATAETVPFLARIAAAGPRGADVLVLLGGIAESTDEHGVPPGTCRAAVAAQLPVLLALTDAADADVRRAAVWAVGHTGASAEAWPVLERRRAEEEDAAVRAELVTALVRLDPGRGAAHAVASLAPDGPPEVRVTAVLACLAAGVPWDGAQRDAVLGSLPADGLVSAFEECEPLQAIVGALLRRDTAEDREAAFALLEAALAWPAIAKTTEAVGTVTDAAETAMGAAGTAAGAAGTVTGVAGIMSDEAGTVSDPVDTARAADAVGAADVRAEAVWAAEHACMVSRSAPARLLPALLPLLDVPESAPAVLALLDKIGKHASAAADVLARLAEEDAPSADLALTALVTADPERAAPLLAAHLSARPRALATASGARAVGNTPSPPPFPFDPGLLDAVRRRLSGGAQVGGAEGTGEGALGASASANERNSLVLLLASWGVRAAAAVPELLDALPAVPVTGPKALASVCPEDGQARDRTVARLREAATGGPDEGRLAAGHALYVLAGDSGPLLTAIRPRLTGSGIAAQEAARLVGVLGEAARPLVPDIRAALHDRADGRTLPRLGADAELAVALWEITGDADTAVAALEAVIRADGGPWTRWTALRAARASVRMGASARPLRPVLEDLLTTPPHAPAAVLALLAALPEAELRGPLDRAVLAGRVLDAAEHGVDADTAFEALAALGPESLTDAHTRRLADLAYGDRRVVTSGIEDQIMRADDRLADRARATLAALHPERPA